MTGAILALWLVLQSEPKAFFETHCAECHDADSKKGGLDLSALRRDFANPETFARWVKVYDRLDSGEMPPRKKPRPPAAELRAATAWLKDSLAAAERSRPGAGGRTALRRLTRAEYENTVRDLLDLPGIVLQSGLPSDGSAHGFDKNSDALDLSHVNMARYIEAADHALDLAIATRPQPPLRRNQHVSLAKHVGHILGNGDAVLLREMKPDPGYPPAGLQGHLDQGAHERMGSFSRGSSVGVFRHEDESCKPSFLEFATLYRPRTRGRTNSRGG
jgi:hypothetical protein